MKLRKIAPFFTFGCLFLASLHSCQPTLVQPTIPASKMARVMADLYVADAATSGFVGYTRDSLAQAYYDQVFEMHQISREQYEQSLTLMAQDTVGIGELVNQAKKLLEADTSRRK